MSTYCVQSLNNTCFYSSFNIWWQTDTELLSNVLMSGLCGVCIHSSIYKLWAEVWWDANVWRVKVEEIVYIVDRITINVTVSIKNNSRLLSKPNQRHQHLENRSLCKWRERLNLHVVKTFKDFCMKHGMETKLCLLIKKSFTNAFEESFHYLTLH